MALALLKTHPWKTNISCAATLMLAGDAIAQKMEYDKQQSMVPSKVENKTDRVYPDTSKLRRRMTLDMKRYDLNDEERKNHSERDSQDHNEEFTFDLVRSASLVSWSAFISSPFFMQVFQLLDKHVPKGHPNALIKRVGVVSLCAIPTNFCFFVYATW